MRIIISLFYFQEIDQVFPNGFLNREKSFIPSPPANSPLPIPFLNSSFPFFQVVDL